MEPPDGAEPVKFGKMRAGLRERAVPLVLLWRRACTWFMVDRISRHYRSHGPVMFKGRL